VLELFDEPVFFGGHSLFPSAFCQVAFKEVSSNAFRSVGDAHPPTPTPAASPPLFASVAPPSTAAPSGRPCACARRGIIPSLFSAFRQGVLICGYGCNPV
jgi:hypothetical protein